MSRIRAWALRVVTLGGTPHGVAAGFALGVGLSLVPIPFLGMLLALALAPVLRFNPVSTYLGTAVINPVTGSLFYFSELWLGMLLTGRPAPRWQELRALDGLGWWRLFGELLGPFLLGAAVMIPAGAALGYLLVRVMVSRWRARNPAPDGAPDEPAGS
ncbi:MAG: DUF2062 domain-containing protein [Myxococcales bacterium]|nr:DUF2062 domain-containing protein [Myxococcales bacterium]